MKRSLVQIIRMSRSEFVRAGNPSVGQRRIALFPPQLDVDSLTKRMADSVTISADDAIPDCLTCGACCVYYWKVPMSRAESEHLGAYIEISDDSETEVVVDRLVPRDFEAGGCAFLTGQLGRDIGCSAYERRPKCCHDFEAGSDRCHEIRRIYGIEPQLSQEEVARFTPTEARPQPMLIKHAACVVDNVRTLLETSSANDGQMISKKRITMKILVSMNDDGQDGIRMHTYDAGEEVWLQSEFIGMTLDEARDLISERTRG